MVDFFETALRPGDESLVVRRATGATILAVVRNGNAVPNPPSDFVLAPDDELLALGTVAQLDQVERLVAERVR